MITLLTGSPGHGKGVYGLDWLITRVKRDNEKNLSEGKPERAVYYSGITDCRIPGWIELDDAKEWFKVPVGSYVLIDECQRIFRTRANGATVPDYVAELETHRHRGLDLLLITQHPMLIDQNVRRLVGQHFHIIRKFGTPKANVHEFMSVVEQPQKSRKGSVVHAYSYNKDIYPLYKSAEVHTVKRNIPMRVYLMYGFPILAGILCWFAFKQLTPGSMHDKVMGEKPSISDQQIKPSISASIDKADDPNKYFTDRTARIAALPQSAPVYDEITKPTIAPVPAACVLIRNKCTCYSQQATKLQTDDPTCRQIVANGFFMDFENKPFPADNKTAQASATPPLIDVAEPVSTGGTVAPASVDVAQQERIPSQASINAMRSSPKRYMPLIPTKGS